MKTTSKPYLILLLLFFSCGQKQEKKQETAKKDYVFQEKLVEGKDTGMVQLKGFKRNNPADLFWQTWRVLKPGTSNPAEWSSAGQEGMTLFKDSVIVVNPGSQPVFGRWWLVMENSSPKSLKMVLEDGIKAEFQIVSITATSMVLSSKNASGQTMEFQFGAEGIAHKNPRNDPFYPDNIKWVIKPLKKEDSLQIRKRVRDCVKFYALYFRDNIKRKRTSISFEGLPDAFDWYDGGMGIPRRDLVSNAWIACFYNEEQCLQGWEVLNKLMKDVDFDWPKGAPNWIYRTEPVLEQMAVLLE
jgi:hypothetical protein